MPDQSIAEVTAVREQQSTKPKSPDVPKPVNAESSKMAKEIKVDLGQPNAKPDEILEDVANFKEEPPAQVPEEEEAKPPENEAGSQPQAEVSPKPEKVAVPEDTQLTYSELRYQHFKQNEVKWKVDEVVRDIDWLIKGEDKEFEAFNEEKIKNGLDWIAEDSNRVSQAVEYIRAQEDIIDLAALPGLNAEERENIDSMYDILRKIRSGLEDRGIVIELHKQPSDMGIEDKDVENVAVPTNAETAFEYAYHATQLINMPSVAKIGLVPSEPWSKEPGTIFFNGYNWATQYLPALGILYRVPISHIPEFSAGNDYVDDNGRLKFEGVDATRHPIPPNLLEYSLDRGNTWRHDFSKFVNNNMNSEIETSNQSEEAA